MCSWSLMLMLFNIYIKTKGVDSDEEGYSNMGVISVSVLSACLIVITVVIAAGAIGGVYGRHASPKASRGEAGVGKDQGRGWRAGEGRGVWGQQPSVLPGRLLRDGRSQVCAFVCGCVPCVR